MKITHLQLKNFRGFTSAAVEMAPMTVIMGTNGSGKTTLLTALLSAWRTTQVAAAAASVDESRCELRDDVLRRALASRVDLSNLIWRDDKASAGSFNLEARWGDVGTDAVLQLEGSRTNEDGCQLGATFETFAGLQRDKHPNHRKSHGVGAALGGTLTLPPPTPLRARIAALSAAQIDEINRPLQRFANAEIVSLTTTPDAAGATLPVYFRRGRTTLELEHANRAVPNLLEALLDIQETLGTPPAWGAPLIVLDEPETHLHPKFHDGFAQYLAATAKNSGAQLVMATHSEEMALRFLSYPNAAALGFEREFGPLRRLNSPSELPAFLKASEGLTLYFYTRLTPFDRYIVDGVIFGVLGRDTDCRIVEFREQGETAIVRLQASRRADLELVAEVLYRRLWEQQVARATATAEVGGNVERSVLVVGSGNIVLAGSDALARLGDVMAIQKLGAELSRVRDDLRKMELRVTAAEGKPAEVVRTWEDKLGDGE